MCQKRSNFALNRLNRQALALEIKLRDKNNRSKNCFWEKKKQEGGEEEIEGERGTVELIHKKSRLSAVLGITRYMKQNLEWLY